MKKLMFLISIVLLFGCSRINSIKFIDEISPIIDQNGADPWVYKMDNKYYYTKTTGNNVTLWQSSQLSTVASGRKKIIWNLLKQFESAWAPEIHYLDNQWIIYVALNKPTETHRMYALINKNKDPFNGNWELQPLKGMDDKFAIDGTVLEIGKNRYFIWSGWPGYENVVQNLYITKMLDLTSLDGEKHLISSPEYKWEKMQTPMINEGPQIFKSGKQINLVYSASGSWDDDYCLGLMNLKIDENPLLKSNWKKNSPVVEKNNSVFGPGHCSFVQDKKGKPWMIFHAALWSHSGWARSIRMQPLLLENNIIQKMKPVDSFSSIKLPNGDKKRIQLLARDATISKNLSLKSELKLPGKNSIVDFSSRSDFAEFNTNIKKDGFYNIFMYMQTKEVYDPNYLITVECDVNGQIKTEKLYPSNYYQPIITQFYLKKGEKSIKVRLPNGGDRIALNRIELVSR